MIPEKIDIKVRIGDEIERIVLKPYVVMDIGCSLSIIRFKQLLIQSFKETEKSFNWIICSCWINFHFVAIYFFVTFSSKIGFSNFEKTVKEEFKDDLYSIMRFHFENDSEAIQGKKRNEEVLYKIFSRFIIKTIDEYLLNYDSGIQIKDKLEFVKDNIRKIEGDEFLDKYGLRDLLNKDFNLMIKEKLKINEEYINKEIKDSNVNLEHQSVSNLLYEVMGACLQMQQMSKVFTLNQVRKNEPIENRRTEFIRMVVNNTGNFKAETQVYMGKSSTNKNPGYVDIIFKNKQKKLVAIGEALNLVGFDKNKIIDHYNKIFGYDNNLLNMLYLINYINVDRHKFDKLWNNYINLLKEDNNGLTNRINKIEILPNKNRYSKGIKVAFADHSFGDILVRVFHLFVYMGGNRINI